MKATGIFVISFRMVLKATLQKESPKQSLLKSFQKHPYEYVLQNTVFALNTLAPSTPVLIAVIFQMFTVKLSKTNVTPALLTPYHDK